MPTWIKRKFLGEVELDNISPEKRTVLKGFRKWWPDGSSCLDIMKYIRTEKGDSCYIPVQHIQIPWELCKKFLKHFQLDHQSDFWRPGGSYKW